MTTIYGIPNCDSVKKARKWLEAQDVAYTFVDVRENTPPSSQVAHWVATLGPEKMGHRQHHERCRQSADSCARVI